MRIIQLCSFAADFCGAVGMTVKTRKPTVEPEQRRQQHQALLSHRGICASGSLNQASTGAAQTDNR
jgi:hypothetical protein